MPGACSSEFKCHATNPDSTFREVESEFFDGKCAEFIEGYCYDDSKGYVQIYPWKPFRDLDIAQRKYEKQQLEECLEALWVMGVRGA